MNSVRPDPTVAANRCRRELTVVDEYVCRETARALEQVHCRRGCAEERLLSTIAAICGQETDPTTQVLLPAALLPPWNGQDAEMNG